METQEQPISPVAMKRAEVRVMRDRYPELLERALALESGADLRSLRGLGRNWNWQNFINQGDLALEQEPPADPHCDCFEAADLLTDTTLKMGEPT